MAVSNGPACGFKVAAVEVVRLDALVGGEIDVTISESRRARLRRSMVKGVEGCDDVAGAAAAKDSAPGAVLARGFLSSLRAWCGTALRRDKRRIIESTPQSSTQQYKRSFVELTC